MPTPSPRHLARARRPWRLLLVAFGFATAVLAALVASATLLPQPEPPRRAPGVALPTITTEPAPTSLTTRTTEPTTTPSPPTSIPDTKPSATSRPITTGGRDPTADAPGWSDTTATSTHATPGATSQLPVTTPSTATEPTTTAASTTTTASSTTTEPTTTLLTTTTVKPTTTGPTTTTTGPTTTQSVTTTTAPVILGGSQPAGVSAMTVGGLLPLLGLLYLLRGLLPRPGGTHAKRRRANRLRRD
jgi:hypothetical protein